MRHRPSALKIPLWILFLVPLCGKAQGWQPPLSWGGGQQESLSAWAQKAGDRYLAGSFEGNLQANGYPLSAQGETDVFVLRLDENGTIARAFDFGGPLQDRIAGMGLHSDKLHLFGSYNISMGIDTLSLQTQIGTKGLYVAQCDTSGAAQWLRGLDGNILTVAGDLAVDEAGNSYLTGYFHDLLTLGNDSLNALSDEGDLFLIKLNPQGQTLWLRQAGISGISRASQIALGPEGQVAVAGAFKGSLAIGGDSIQTNTTDQDLFLAIWDAEGNALSGQKFGGVLEDEISDLQWDHASGAIFLAGQFLGVLASGEELNLQSSSLKRDAFLIKTAPGGPVEWGYRFGGPEEDYITALSLHPDEIAVAGYFQQSTDWNGNPHTATGNLDGFWAQLNTEGGVENFQPISGSAFEVPACIGHFPNGTAWLAGTQNGILHWGDTLASNGGYDLFWTQTAFPLPNTEYAQAELGFFPNPSRQWLQQERGENFILYNVQGRAVAQSESGRLDVSALPPGLYFARLIRRPKAKAQRIVIY